MTARPTTYRRTTLPKPDRQGRWRAVVGRTKSGTLARFQVGTKKTTSEGDALKRLQAIQDLYDRQCRETDVTYWHGWVQGWAFKMSQGVPVVVHATTADPNNQGAAYEDLLLVRRLQAWGAPIIITDPQLQTGAYAFVRQEIDDAVARAVNQAMEQVGARLGDNLVEETQQQTHHNPDPANAPTGTLHATLDAFAEHLKKTGKKDGSGNIAQHARKVLEMVKALKKHHANCQLWQMDFNGVEVMVNYWRNRPGTKRGTRCSIDYARILIQTIYRYLRWLDCQPKFRWTMPKGVDNLDRRPHALPEDDAKHSTAFHSKTTEIYTPEQLATLVEHTDAFGKAMIGVCVNCAFGAAEVGQWRMSDYHLNAKHPHAAALGIISTDTDSWVVGKRPKTAIYGEHLLWEDVANAVRPFLDGRDVLPITVSTGKAWFQSDRGNGQTYFRRWWLELLDEVVAENPTFPCLPFGSLRDLLPDILRREYSDEVASLALQHGKTSNDDLLKCYTNLPFTKLFTATRELRTMFKPFLDALQPTSIAVASEGCP
jgi:hypothetical protein